ncbi:MAG: FKBP-type peptidyl-prolyl cis-trans isomerase [Armatimonadota bacterium]|nr:FKBP-type peptidyl-prolyl cis-trans isomerase [Armatimonadota bacterium]
MRLAVIVPFLLLAGCREPESFDRALSNTQSELAARARKLDTTKPPPDIPLPADSPKQIDIQKVNAESAKITALKIADVQLGSGPQVAPGKYVTVHYVGMLPDGYVFHSSYKIDPANPGAPPAPYTFLYDPAHPAVIQGWMKGLIGMKVGGHRRLTVPTSMAYGAEPAPGSPIPPNAALIFEVQLMFVGDTQ